MHRGLIALKYGRNTTLKRRDQDQFARVLTSKYGRDKTKIWPAASQWMQEGNFAWGGKRHSLMQPTSWLWSYCMMGRQNLSCTYFSMRWVDLSPFEFWRRKILWCFLLGPVPSDWVKSFCRNIHWPSFAWMKTTVESKGQGCSSGCLNVSVLDMCQVNLDDLPPHAPPHPHPRTGRYFLPLSQSSHGSGLQCVHCAPTDKDLQQHVFAYYPHSSKHSWSSDTFCPF